MKHNKKLKEPEQALQNLLPREVVRHKLGPILFQLPPGWKVNVERLETFLEALPSRHDYAFEFREASWNTEGVYQTLRQYNAAYCIGELTGYHTPIVVTADFTTCACMDQVASIKGAIPSTCYMNGRSGFCRGSES